MNGSKEMRRFHLWIRPSQMRLVQYYSIDQFHKLLQHGPFYLLFFQLFASISHFISFNFQQQTIVVGDIYFLILTLWLNTQGV